MEKSKNTDKHSKKIRKTMETLTPNLSEKDKKLQEEAMDQIFNQGKPIKEALKVSDETLEFLYGQAYRLYKIGQYKESNRYFHLLYLFDSKDLRFTMGIAACHHMAKEYMKAVLWYMLCASQDSESPLPYYHISDCFLKLGNKVSALISLKMMEARMGNNPNYDKIRERVLRTINTLSNELHLKENNASVKEEKLAI